MVVRWCSVLLGVMLVGCSARSAASVDRIPDDAWVMRVATYNINFGNGDDPETIEAIAALDADLVLLQETTGDSELAIRSALETSHPHMRFHHCCRAGGLGVLSRYPIVDEEILEATVGYFPAWWGRIDTPRGELVALDVHLRPPMSDGGSWVAGYFSTREVRMRELGSFWSQLPETEAPVLIAGDFNEGADGRAIGLMKRHGLHSVLPRFDRRAKTWHWPVGAGELKMMLDHVLTRPPLQPVAAEVREAGVSDHYPVVVELAWP